MDLKAVRAFVAIADSGQFQKAAVDLSLTQQAVSKRIAALEKDLGVRLLVRTARGADLTIDGQALLPHARALLQAEERAVAAVSPGDRALRVDVVGRRVATAGLVRDFHLAHPQIALDVVTLFGADTALAAVRDGAVDATFRAVTMPGHRLPDGVEAVPVLDEPLRLCVGPGHEFARAASVTPAQLAGHRIWMPGNEPGTEWAAYYDELAATFGPTLDTIGPNFGVEALLDTIAASPTLATFLSERTPLVWPTDHDLRLVPVRDPMPVYPHALLWRTDNPHPGLAALRDHLLATRPRLTEGAVWRPSWAESVR
ncbi:LysR family transcriptional regulator [Streptomyces violarus]|uniref:DNA-binding transcriptional LysR family regulator n=1 Tax=Streptomyces violarus TaxID=67380 RepID=A0A7W4ZYL6_9ACTN|nr:MULTISPECIES: LysR family transcriptional regulator [Streptomyces]MBB3081164.1 DNA-binding transcriptional LysR family regulator [Streptomyces violarus]WRU00273.1 LysR family transcriptional regulator [Streptomyces sp. CGMCC 4.1772]GHD12799.1 LysR family transcriptional regulator [Streptomyces violarus]